jgi:hypothetical protein
MYLLKFTEKKMILYRRLGLEWKVISGKWLDIKVGVQFEKKFEISFDVVGEVNSARW